MPEYEYTHELDHAMRIVLCKNHDIWCSHKSTGKRCPLSTKKNSRGSHITCQCYASKNPEDVTHIISDISQRLAAEAEV